MASNERTELSLTAEDQTSQDRFSNPNIEYAFKEAFGRLLSEGPNKQRYLENPSLVQRKVPILVDAFERGINPLLSLVESEGMERPAYGGMAVAKFRLEGELLRWNIVPKSVDPFERLKFIQEIEDQGLPTQGEQIVWEDPYFIYQATVAGQREQDQSYSQFLQTCETVGQTVRGYSYSIKLIPSIEELFNQCGQAQAELAQESRLFAEERDAFAILFLMKNRTILDTLPQIDQAVDQFQRLIHLSVPRQPRSSEAGEQRVTSLQFNNSLLINLLFNPDSLRKLPDFRFPQTDIDTLYKGLSFIKNIRDKSPEGDYELALLVAKSLQDCKGLLRSHLGKLGIRFDYGYEFLFNLLISRIKSRLPGEDYINISSLTDNPLLHRADLNQIYSLNQRLVSNKQVEGHVPALARFTETSLVETIMKRSWNIGMFRHLSDSELERVLTNIFSHPTFKNPEYQKVNMEKLLRIFRLRFSPELKRFTNSQANPFRSTNLKEQTKLPNQAGIKKTQIALLKILIRSIESGNQSQVTILDDLITTSALPYNLKRRGFTSYQGNFRLRMTDLNRRCREDPSPEEARELFESQAAAYALFLAYSDGPESGNFDFAIGNTLNIIKRYISGNYLFGGLQRYREVRSRIGDQMNNLFGQFQADYFSKLYFQDQKQYMIEMLQDSIDHLSI